MGFFNELKRRNVIRVGIAYLVASWLLLQVIDVVLPILKMPDWVAQLMLLLLVVGFCVSLVISWVYEITPDGIRRESAIKAQSSISSQTARKLDLITIGLLSVVVAIVVVDRFVPGPTGPSTRLTESQPISKPAISHPEETELQPEDPVFAATPSVAVLPFANMSSDPDNEYFSEGISEELLNLLVKVDGLRVPSRTSSFAFKGQNTDIRDIAKQLQVGHILEGSVRKDGNQVRITAQLIDVKTDTHLWSETYDRDLKDIFAVQNEIATQIVAVMKLVLQSGVITDRPTENLQAYTLYLQGRYLFQQREQSLLEAENLLRQSVVLDPRFAAAWAMLAMTYAVQPSYVKVDQEESFNKARDAAAKALALEPGLAEAMLAIANVEESEGQINESLKHYDEIAAQHPNHATARLWWGVNFIRAGYLPEALEQFTIAISLDPTHGVLLDWFARALLGTGQLPEAYEAAARAVALGRYPSRVSLMYYFLETGNYAGMDVFLGDSDDHLSEMIRWVFLLSEDPQLLREGLAWADQIEKLNAGFLPEYARLAFQLNAGSSADFFKQLGKVQTFNISIVADLWLPSAKRHRQSPEMKRFAQEAGLVDLWQSRGWPDLCRPVGKVDFECD